MADLTVSLSHYTKHTHYRQLPDVLYSNFFFFQLNKSLF